MLILELINNEDDIDAKKDSKQLKKIMLSSDEWELLQNLIITLGPFEEATRYLSGEKYITHSIMIPIIERIKHYYFHHYLIHLVHLHLHYLHHLHYLQQFLIYLRYFRKLKMHLMFLL